MRVFAVFALLAFTLLRPAAFADDAATGVLTIEITDAAKKGVAGIVITAKVNGTEVSATTGSEQPSDAELGAATRQGPKVAEALVSKYNARATLTGIPLGTASITLVGIRGARPISATITADQPTWRLTATVNGKTIVGAAKIVFDEVANAKLQTERAKAEQAKAKVAADAAKAEQERARQLQEKARQDQERARQDKDRADADAKRARDLAEAERLKRAKSEAPSKISVAAQWCKCGPNKTITVSCRVTSTAEVAVDVAVSAFAESAVFGVNSNGKRDLTGLGAGKSFDLEVLTSFSALKNCSGCKSQRCTIVGVTPK